jgi:hypothetical protein
MADFGATVSGGPGPNWVRFPASPFFLPPAQGPVKGTQQPLFPPTEGLLLAHSGRSLHSTTAAAVGPEADICRAERPSSCRVEQQFARQRSFPSVLAGDAGCPRHSEAGR